MTGREKNLAVLIAEVVGSHKLLERLGKDETARAVDRVIKRMDRAITGYNGRVARVKGDRIVVAFPGASEAFHAALEMQQRVHDLPAVSFVKLAIRVAFHYGPTIELADDLSGEAANIAGRLVGMAEADRILTSQSALQMLTPQQQEVASPSGLAGFPGVEVFEVDWSAATAEERALRNSNVQAVFPNLILLLEHKGGEVRVDAEHPRATLGRDPANTLVVDDRKASRHHARIERRGEQYFLIDESTNGTYVRRGEREQLVRREEVLLEGAGQLACGTSLGDTSGHVVKFSHQ